MKVDISETIEDEFPVTKQQELEEAQKAVKGSAPLIPDAPDVMVKLPRGRLVGSKWEGDVELRELTGADEEALARFKDPLEFFDGVIVLGTCRIGSQDLTQLSFAERREILLGLLIGEREQLFLHISRVTYGDEKEIKHTCPYCATEATTTVIVSQDIKIPEMENPTQATFTFTTRSGDVLTYRLATGADQQEATSIRGASTPEQNTRLLSLCVSRVNDAPILDPIQMARNLSMADRTRLLDILVSNQPSPDLSLEVPCVSCGQEVVLPITWGDLFRP